MRVKNDIGVLYALTHGAELGKVERARSSVSAPIEYGKQLDDIVHVKGSKCHSSGTVRHAAPLGST